jgi:hypothetical protein
MRTKVNVLKPFPYLDGDLSLSFAAGEERDIRADHVAGLVDGGYVERVSDAPALPLPAQAEQRAPEPEEVTALDAPENKRRKRK